MKPRARNTARGTVRAGSCTSPLGASAISTPTNAKISSRTVSPSALARRHPGPREVGGSHGEEPGGDEQQERQQLQGGEPLHERDAGAHAAHVDEGKTAEKQDDERRAPGAGAERRDEDTHRRGERGGYPRAGEDVGEPQHHAGEKPGVAAERALDVAVDAAARGDAASGESEAGDDERDGGEADQERQGRRGADAQSHRRRQDEDAGTDRAVHHARPRGRPCRSRARGPRGTRRALRGRGRAWRSLHERTRRVKEA